MGKHPLVSSSELLPDASRATVRSDAGLRRLFDILDGEPGAAPKEAAAASISGRTVWEFRRVMSRLSGYTWRDFVRILHLRERRAQGDDRLKKATSVAADAGFSSRKTMRAAEAWARKKGIPMEGTLPPPPSRPASSGPNTSRPDGRRRNDPGDAAAPADAAEGGYLADVGDRPPSGRARPRTHREPKTRRSRHAAPAPANHSSTARRHPAQVA